MDSTKKHKVEILSGHIEPQPLTRGVLVEESQSLLEGLLNQKIDIDHSCGGNGTCGTCHYFIIEGAQNISDREDLEQELAHDRGFLPEERLACQSYLKGSVKIQIR